MESELVRLWYRFTGGRPSSAPYLTGDGYRALTPWRYDPDSGDRFDAGQVPANSTVFCKTSYLEKFLQTVAPRLVGPIVVVSANGDHNFTESHLSLIPPAVTKLWVQNCDVNDDRVEPLPIGIENASQHSHGIVADFESCRRNPGRKVNRILWGFTEATNPTVRKKARTTLQRCAVADHVAAPNSRVYRKIAARYRFVASPPGNGLDCHRTWEALYLRVVPIVLRSMMMEHFVGLGLPLWLVDSYEEIEALTENDLEQRYATLEQTFDHPALWMDYWKKAIFEDL